MLEVSNERLAEIAKQVGTTDMDLVSGRELHAMATELLRRRSASNAGGVEVKALEIADALDEFSDIDEAEGGNPHVIATEREAAKLLRILSSLAAEAEPVASVDHHAYRVAHVACPHFIADPCGSSKCAGCGKRRAEHRTHSCSSVIAEVTVTDEMVERGLDAPVVGNCPAIEYLDFNASDARELGVLIEGENFAGLDIIRHQQWRDAGRAIVRAILTASLIGGRENG